MEQPPVLPPRGPAETPSAPATSTALPSNSRSEESVEPSSGVKPLEGKTTLDVKLAFESEVLCHKAISKIAAQIAEEFCDYRYKISNEKQACVIFLDETIKPSLQLRESVAFQIEQLTLGFRQLLLEQVKQVPKTRLKGIITDLQTGITTAATLGRSVIDLLALFRADVSYTGYSVTVKETSFILELARKLQGANCAFIYPKLLLSPVSANSLIYGEHTIETLLTTLFNERERAVDVIRQLASELAKNESTLTEDIASQPAEKKRSLKQAAAAQRLEFDDKNIQLENLEAKLKLLQDTLATYDEKNGIPTLHSIKQADQILSRFEDKDKDTYFFWGEILTAGGNYRIRRSLFQTMFCENDGLSYSGGAIVTFAFLDRNAHIILSGTHRYREPFISFPVREGKESEANSF